MTEWGEIFFLHWLRKNYLVGPTVSNWTRKQTAYHKGDSVHPNCLKLGTRSVPPEIIEDTFLSQTIIEHRQWLVGDVNPTLNVLKVSRVFLVVEMCRGAPSYCVPLLVHLPMSGLEKCCSVHHHHITTSLERCYLFRFLLDGGLSSNTT